MQLAGKQFLPRQRNFMVCFGAGLLFGIILINIGKSFLLGETGLFDEYTLSHMNYILRKRMSRMLILAVLSSTYLGLIICMGAAFWYGMSAGTFLAALSLRYGLKGILLAVISLFPHYLLYVPAILLLLIWCEELFRGIYVRGEMNAQDRGFLLKKAGRLLVILAVAGAGCLLEGYLNPYLLLGFLKIF